MGPVREIPVYIRGNMRAKGKIVRFQFLEADLKNAGISKTQLQSTSGASIHASWFRRRIETLHLEIWASVAEQGHQRRSRVGAIHKNKSCLFRARSADRHAR